MPIAFTGLRSGDKMTEEFVSDRESVEPTGNTKLHRVKTPEIVSDKFDALMRDLSEKVERRELAAALALLLILSLTSCEPGVGRPAVSLSLAREAKSPRDAAVLIDEEYIGPLGYVAARGVRLPIGKHRITVEKPGYFPWDRLVEADRDARDGKPVDQHALDEGCGIEGGERTVELHHDGAIECGRGLGKGFSAASGADSITLASGSSTSVVSVSDLL